MAALRCASPSEPSAVNLCSVSTWGAAARPGPPFLVFGTKQVLWTLGPAGSPFPPSQRHPQRSHLHTPGSGQVLSPCESSCDCFLLSYLCVLHGLGFRP